MEVFLIIDTWRYVSLHFTLAALGSYWSVVSLNWISVPSEALVCDGMNIGPRGASKSVILGGGSLYLIGARASLLFLCFGVLALGSGVVLELVSGACSPPPFDSRFFSDSFFALEVRSRAKGVSSLEDLKSGFNGEETVGRWSSSRARFCGIEEIGALATGSDFVAGSGVDIVKAP
jgi:hypothetical protein